ncbi:acetate--CoA ligase family protein [Gordonia rhizosphera]|uniref:Putative acetyl-CoA synthetase n=1 Tax=Gordonia rhizosphera NBRC 16068 TaxID=1108045 RepID=K6VVC0_9ACTN|nr:acetate--CoA ligase family protein [Gordonia rhizosphera]GAB90805.1 putative acetyl-CoA synthetase [Gordonia rhizosphera NBRC 16068]
MTALTSRHAPTPPTVPLDRLFRPSSVAVVGASANPGKLGSAMLTAVSGTTPSVYGINPREDGAPFHPTLGAAVDVHGAPIDLAVLCIPAEATPAALTEAAGLGAGSALICSGGFAETGEPGAALQAQLAEISARTGIRVLGPNTSGFFRPDGVIASFVPTVPEIRPGSVAVVAASGGMNHALSFLLSERGVGIGLGVGLGNSVDVSIVDVLRYAGDDPTISAIALHIENVDDGRALLAAVREVSTRKPVVAIVVGRSDVSAFAESHTGSLATSWRTSRALLAEAGAVIVDNDFELVDALTVLSQTRLAPGPDPAIGVVTAQAGPGLMILDELQTRKVAIPRLADETIRNLSKVLPPLTFQENPVDTGRPGPTFARVLSMTAADPQIDAVAVYSLAEPGAIDLGDAVRQSRVTETCPVVLGIGGPAGVVEGPVRNAESVGAPTLLSPTSLAVGVDALVRDARQRFYAADAPVAIPATTAGAVTDGLDEAAAKDLLDDLGIATPQRRVCRDREAAHRALTELTKPIAVKILDATVLHKTDVGGVHLGVSTPGGLDAALDALDAIGAPAYLLETMAPPGVELILGARRDPAFGPILVAGLGGTAAEAIGDISIRSSRLTVAGGARMLDDLDCAPLLNGWRGGPTLDRAAFARVATTLIGFLEAHPEVEDIEINPLRLTTSGLIALDAVIVPTSTSKGKQS